MKNEKENLIHYRMAARQYGLPPKWLREQAMAGKIPAVIAEKQVLFDADVLSGWLSQRAKGETAHE